MSKVYPARAELVTAIRNSDLFLKVDELKGGTPFLNGTSLVQYSGGFTTVFPFQKVSGEKVAVRCWIAEIDDAKYRTQVISDYLSTIDSNYFVRFEYVENGILAGGNLHPVVIMEWVEGQTLKDYLNEVTFDQAVFSERAKKLSEEFKKLVEYFHKNNIAHGDLQHGNLMVLPNGELKVIDYDSMYVPKLTGKIDHIKGLPGYQHPSRRAYKEVTPKLDYFSELVIYLSLIIYSEYPDLWREYVDTEDFLFSVNDYKDPHSSRLFSKYRDDKRANIGAYTSRLLDFLNCSTIDELVPLEEAIIGPVDKIKSIWENGTNSNNRAGKKYRRDVKKPPKKDISKKF